MATCQSTATLFRPATAISMVPPSSAGPTAPGPCSRLPPLVQSPSCITSRVAVRPTTARLRGGRGLVQGSDGNFYGTTYQGGSNFFGTVFKMTPAGVLTNIHIFQGQSAGDGIWPFSQLIQGTDGFFYGTTSGGGAARLWLRVQNQLDWQPVHDLLVYQRVGRVQTPTPGSFKAVTAISMGPPNTAAVAPTALTGAAGPCTRSRRRAH